MRRLQTPHDLPYRVVEDTRREPLRLGKYVYLLILAGIVLFVVHRGVGHIYLQRGEGFVHASAWTLAVEYDTTVRKLWVDDGQRVQAGDKLADVSSAAYEERALKLTEQVASAEQRVNAALIELASLKASIGIAEAEYTFAHDRHDKAQAAADRGLMRGADLSDYAHRRFRAERELEGLRVEAETLEAALPAMRAAAKRVRAHYERVETGFSGGQLTASRAGVVTGLKASIGGVVPKGTPILSIYGEDRFVLGYLDQHSWVGYQAGDPILAQVKGYGWTLARISDATAVAERLPAEFQPQFRRAMRDNLVRIEVPDAVIERASMLSTVTLYKPFGLEWGIELWRGSWL